MPIERLLKHVYELPSIPKVVQELIASFSSRKDAASDISARIQTDPVIAAKVLRLANSARYGVGRKVSSIDSAVVLLGFDALKTLVVASGVTTAMANIPGLDMKQFWRESFMVANIAKTLAKCSNELDIETAFTCGLLHKIGIALMYLGNAERMQTIDKTLAADEVRQKQRDYFGYESNEVGARLAEIWRFPQVIQTALLHQSDPLNLEPLSPYAGLIYVAVLINTSLLNHVPVEDILHSLPKPLLAVLHLDTFAVFERLKQLCDAEDDIDSLLAA